MNKTLDKIYLIMLLVFINIFTTCLSTAVHINDYHQTPIEKPVVCGFELRAMENICDAKDNDVCRVAQWTYLKCVKNEKVKK